MFQSQLTSKLIPEKIIIAVVPALTFFSFSLMPLIIGILVLLLMLMLVPYSIYTIYMAHLNIAFDASLVYITDRKTERIIAMKSIRSIKPVSNFALLRKQWQISYVENDLEEELSFYPADNTAIEQLIKAAKAQNPLVSTSY
jgi:hypothetical protein